MRESSDGFIQHATKTWVALTIEILVTTFLFVSFNLIGISRNNSVLLTLIVAIIAVFIGVNKTFRGTFRDAFERFFRLLHPAPEMSAQSRIEVSTPIPIKVKPTEHPQPEDVHTRYFLDLDQSKYNEQLVIFLAQDLTEQSRIDQLCASHLTWHLDFQRDAWNKTEPAILQFITHKSRKMQVTPILLKSALNEQLYFEQGWIESLIWNLTAQSQIKENSAKMLLQSSDIQQLVTFLIQNLTKESHLAETCAVQIKLNMSVQAKAIQQWSAFLKHHLVERREVTYKGFEIILKQLDMQIRFEQEISKLLKQGFDIQKKSEQFWIVAFTQSLPEDQFRKELFKRFMLTTESTLLKQIRDVQTKAEQEWVETLIKHSEEDKMAEQKLDEMLAYNSTGQPDEQIEVEIPAESQSWQSVVDSIERSLEKRLQIKEEVARTLAESLEEQSQIKQEAANLLKESLID